MIQLIEKQYKSYILVVNGLSCTFIPMSLFLGNNLIPLRPQVHKTKGYLFWNVGGVQVSYNMIKKAVKRWKIAA